MNRQQLLATLEKIKATQAAKRGEIGVLMGKSLEAGTTPNAEDEAAIQSLEAEIKALGTNFARVEDMIKALDEENPTLEPVAGANEEEGIKSSGVSVHKPRVQTPEHTMEKGVELAQLCRAKLTSTNLAKNHGEYVSASDILKSWGATPRVMNVAKAVIGTTTDANFASALVDTQNLAAEFLDFLRPRTIIGQMQNSFRNVPFNITVPTKTGASIVNWVGESKAKPVTNPQFDKVTLGFAKIAGIVPFSDELSRFSNPKVDLLVRDDLADSIIEFMDGQFIDPSKAETADSPASVLNGVTAIVASGLTLDNIKTDLRKLRSGFIAQNLSMTDAYYVMSETLANFIADLTDALGNSAFKGMDAPVGQKHIKGIRVVESEKAGPYIALLKPSEILLADDGGIDISVSQEASLDLGGGITVNLWQQNLIAIRAERYVRWKKRHAAAAGYIDYSAQTFV